MTRGWRERLMDRYYGARYMRTGGSPCMCTRRPWWLRHRHSCKSSRAAMAKWRATAKPLPRPLPED